MELQTKLYHLQPDLFDRSKKKPPKASEDPQVLKIQRKIANIESDVLFDRREAEFQWKEKLDQLRKEAAIFGRPTVREVEMGKEKPAPPKQSEAKVDEKDDDDEEEENADMLGNMFDDTETPILDAIKEARLGNTTPPVPENSSAITFRDIGKWTGLSPRRVLEEACKARYASPPVEDEDI